MTGNIHLLLLLNVVATTGCEDSKYLGSMGSSVQNTESVWLEEPSSQDDELRIYFSGGYIADLEYTSIIFGAGEDCILMDTTDGIMRIQGSENKVHDVNDNRELSTDSVKQDLDITIMYTEDGEEFREVYRMEARSERLWSLYCSNLIYSHQ